MANVSYTIGRQTFFVAVSPETYAKLVKASKCYYDSTSPDPIVKATLKLYGEISEVLLIKYLKEELDFG